MKENKTGTLFVRVKPSDKTRWESVAGPLNLSKWVVNTLNKAADSRDIPKKEVNNENSDAFTTKERITHE